ncbi:hypothetical protein AVW11_14120 [Streptomyces amritsarensis]|uniref:Secreted protein n=1 Tax=Streptomyces amritsarensis TaxID=681158 RepID=A0ABX3G327_9ACTN|nr:hypothetical protein [Streptomyces amritsarensis]OLZ67346.1 hypothetical protein AVW11_14120 [Streptomyces amritsarensis]
MTWRRHARAALTRALTAACVVLLCVFGAGPAGAAAAEYRPASSAPGAPAAPGEPAEPAEGQSDPAADSEARAAVRSTARGPVCVQRTPLTVFHVKQGEVPGRGPRTGAAEPALSLRTVRTVVLRC